MTSSMLNAKLLAGLSSVLQPVGCTHANVWLRTRAVHQYRLPQFKRHGHLPCPRTTTPNCFLPSSYCHHCTLLPCVLWHAVGRHATLLVAAASASIHVLMRWHEITLSDGSLGSCVDEERSQLRELM